MLSASMKCHRHPTDAIGVCAYCGRGLCPDCARPADANPRLVCSPGCADALARDDRAMQAILQKSVQSARASAYYSYLCAALSAGGAIGADYYLPSPYLIAFTSACAVIFAASGFWYGRIARRQTGA
jgi:hypothetical protein